MSDFIRPAKKIDWTIEERITWKAEKYFKRDLMNLMENQHYDLQKQKGRPKVLCKKGVQILQIHRKTPVPETQKF